MFLSRFRESVRCFLNEWNRKCCVGTGKTGESQYFLLKTISPHLNEKPHSSIPKKTRVYNNSDTGICCEVLRYTWHLLSHYICIQILNTCPWKLVVGFKKKKRKYFPGYQFITSRNLSTRLRIVIVRRKLVLVTVLRHEGLFDWRSFVWTQEKDVRIIIGNFDERSARKVFCQVRQWSKSSSWSDNSLWEFFQGLVVAVYLNFFFCRRYDQPRFCFKQIARNTFYWVRQRLASPKASFSRAACVSGLVVRARFWADVCLGYVNKMHWPRRPGETPSGNRHRRLYFDHCWTMNYRSFNSARIIWSGRSGVLNRVVATVIPWFGWISQSQNYLKSLVKN